MRIAAIVLACLLLPFTASAECLPKQDHRNDKSGGIQVGDFIMHGTQKLGSREVSAIASTFTGACFNDDSDELGERLRAEFQNRGYMMVEVKNVRIKTTDALASPKLVDVEAEVSEGPRYRISETEFTGNHAFATAELRKTLPLRKGDIFDRAKIAGGLQAMRKLYGSQGYLDAVFIPDTLADSDQYMRLSISFEEGKQYHMGGLYFQAKKETAERLQQKWDLPQGKPFDWLYIGKFVEQNRAQLPETFAEEGGVEVIQNCQEATVQVVFHIDTTQPLPSFEKATCESATPPASQ